MSKSRYLKARDDELDLDTARAHWVQDEKVFLAGVQYALDRYLEMMRGMTVGVMHFEHSTAASILESVKKKGPSE